MSTEVSKRRYKSVAVVTTQNDAMLGLRDFFRASRSATILLDEEVTRDEVDFTTVATKVASKHPDAVYVLLYPPQVAPFAKKLREVGYRGQLFGAHNIEDPHEVETSNGAMTGMWFANGDDSSGEDYPSLYLERFGTATALGGASGYDSAKLIIDATMSGKDLNTYLHSVRNFQGAFGKYSATPRADFDFPAVIKRVTSTGFIMAR